MRLSLISTLVILLLAAIISPSVYGQIWVESSSGLVPPSMEGGNTELEFADINGDGNVDLMTIGDHGSPYVNTDEHGITVWFGNGAGSWSVYQNGNFGYGGIAVGDVNNDGFLDVGYGMHHNYSGQDFGDQLIEVALGNGTGMVWTPYDDGLATAGEDWGMFGTDFADIDADGDLDLVSVSFGAGSGLHVYRNNGDGSWTHIYGFNGGNSGLYIEFGDINGDGYPDIASTTSDSAIFINDGAGGFHALTGGGMTPPGAYGYHDIALGDIDNDGKDEVAIVAQSNTINVWKLNPDGTTWTDLSYNLSGYSGAEMVDIADMNGDGFLDVIGYGNRTIGIFAGNGGTAWTLLYNFLTPSPGYASALRAGADIDHNGYGDIAVVNDEGSWWSSYNHCRVYKENSVPTQLSIVPVYPHGHEVLRGGAAGWIEWISAVPFGQNTTVDIEFSQSGAQGPFQLIALGVPNNGKHQLPWPDGINSVNCYLRLTVHGQSNVSAITPFAFEIRSNLVTELSIDMMPDNPPIVVPQGGSFTYTGILISNANQPLLTDVWVMLTVPGYGLYGPVQQYNSVPLTPYDTIIVSGITQYVPIFAPLGTYAYTAYCGDYPNIEIDQASFPFTVTSLQTGLEAENWNLSGWFSEGEIDGNNSKAFAFTTSYPNPFNAQTTIAFDLPASGKVSLEIYNLLGEEIAMLAKGNFDAGRHSVIWNAGDYPSGVYYCRLQFNGRAISQRLTLIK